MTSPGETTSTAVNHHTSYKVNNTGTNPRRTHTQQIRWQMCNTVKLTNFHVFYLLVTSNYLFIYRCLTHAMYVNSVYVNSVYVCV